MIVLDFETRSTADIKRGGAYKYAQDPSTSVMCMGFSIDDAPVQLWYPDEFRAEVLAASPDASLAQPASLVELFRRIEAGDEVSAHNAGFEWAIWEFVCIPRLGWPRIPEASWTCTAAMAAVLSLPRRLEGACQALGLPVQKDMAGNRLMKTMTKPRRPSKKEPGLRWFEDGERLVRLFAYCRADVEAQRALRKALPPLPETERRVWALDQQINRRGVGVDRSMVRGAMAVSDQLEARMNAEIDRVTKSAVTTTGQVGKLLEWAQTRSAGATVRRGDKEWPATLMLGDLQKETIRDALELEGWPEDVRDALVIRQLASNSSVKKYAALLDRCCDDGRARGLLLYMAAGTGRWAGVAFQPQNLPREAPKPYGLACEQVRLGDYDLLDFCYPNVGKVLAGCVRGALVAAPGYKLVAVDFSQIEARGVLWAAGDPGIQFFTSGRPYEEMAAEIFKRPVESIGKDSFERLVGKQTILGFGYGMGAPKFKATLAKFGIEVDDDLAERAKQVYRSKFPQVPALWRAMEAAAIQAVKTGRPQRIGRFRWSLTPNGKFLALTLPSGRAVYYFGPRVGTKATPWGEQAECLTYVGEDSQTHQWRRMDTYGGMLVENAVQALCRDIMAYGGLERAEAAGYPPVLHIHDEIVAEVRIGFGSPKELASIVSAPLPWTDGFPIAADGWEGPRYRK